METSFVIAVSADVTKTEKLDKYSSIYNLQDNNLMDKITLFEMAA